MRSARPAWRSKWWGSWPLNFPLVSGFELAVVANPAAVREITSAIGRLREVLGDQTYGSLARKGETMTTAAMVTYAYDEIGPAEQI